MLSAAVMFAMGCALLAGLGGCSTNPATGKRVFTLLSWNQEIALGLEAGPQFTQEFGGEVNDASIREYLDTIGHSLKAGIEEGVPDLPWKFTMLDSEVINAFALPGGQVYMSRGLAVKLENEAQLAGIIGHEIGHVTARHGNQRVSQVTGLNIALAAGQVAIGVAGRDSQIARYGQVGLPALQVGGQVVLLSYGRSQELEADLLGMRYMSRAGYNPAAQRRVMEILAAEAGRGTQPEFLSTHPYPETRIEQIDSLMASTYADWRNRPNDGLYADRFEQRLLSPFRRMAPPRHGRQTAWFGVPENVDSDGAGGSGGGGGVATLVTMHNDHFALHDPTTWCWHCAVEADVDGAGVWFRELGGVGAWIR